jgi:hypothetical protein
MWQMSLTSLLIKLSTAPLALDPIVSLGRHVCCRVEIGGTIIVIASGNLHSLSEHHGLKLPFWNFATWLSSWLRFLLGSIRFVVFVLLFNLVNTFSLPHFFCVKSLSLVDKNFLANLFVLLKSCLSKVSTASGTRNSRTIILLLGVWR